MNIAKHSNDSNLRPLQKKRLPFKYELGSMILASLLGTYLDLYFVGKELYQYPIRPFPEIFSINIGFTLIGLPLLTLIVLRCISQLTNWGKAGVILFVSLLMAILERLADLLGLFSHAEEWNHLYPFFCYGLFFVVIVLFQEWMKRNIN